MTNAELREKRSNQRLAEAMADTAEMSAEMAAAGMISPEAHAETVRLTTEVAKKFGHNSGAAAHTVARDQLRAFIERVEFIEAEIKELNDEKRDIYAEAKGTGFDPKIIKKVIAIRRQDRDQRAEEEAILETYLIALGMLESTPDA